MELFIKDDLQHCQLGSLFKKTTYIIAHFGQIIPSVSIKAEAGVGQT